MDQAYVGSAIVLLALLGLIVSNLLRDRGVDRDLACRVPAVKSSLNISPRKSSRTVLLRGCISLLVANAPNSYYHGEHHCE